jgi:2-(1,2-epoxy-1,2-dihydrophenyl)acetyl-CoA isomerase
MSSFSTEVVELRIRDRVAHLTFLRAEAANAINPEVGRQFLAHATAIAAATDVRAVLLTGRGKSFCVGGDLKGMIASGENIQQFLRALTTDLHAGMLKLSSGHAPIVAAVNGAAAGAGLGLVLFADIAIAARSARFLSAYTGIGLTPDAGCTYLLPRAVGYKRAMELFMTNRMLDADEALDWGLINQVVDDGALMEAATSLAQRLAAAPPNTFRALKRLMAHAEPDFASQLERESLSIAARGDSPEGREAIAAFLEKRPARF